MSRPRILVVDDEQHIVSLLSMTLRKEGYEIVSANSGEKALALLGVFEFKMVITDHTMPGMDGLELSTLIDDSLPVLMITSRPQILKERVHRLTDVIHKPFSPRDVAAKVRDIIGPGDEPKEQTT
ncbi:MAG: response regulator [Phycisphaeraceae bacterium]|nr:response regulator [Phycisphaeraceae bacterium]